MAAMQIEGGSSPKGKVCSKCHVELPANEESFGPRKVSSDGLTGQCRGCMRDAGRGYDKKRVRPEGYRGQQRELGAAYRKTVTGRLHRLFHVMHDRCAGQAGYENIECAFDNVNEFIDYVINIMQVDPRGLDCHRIDNDGNYAPGNIEFKNPHEHQAQHNRERAKNGK